MIPQAYITAWQSKVPWPAAYQVEQDLILSRVMIMIASDDALGSEFVMRGGTCLHKLHLPEPYRYSEDLDYVRRNEGSIGPYLDRLRVIAGDCGLTWKEVDFSGPMVHVILDAEPTVPPGRIRIKIETNIAEIEFFRPTMTIDHEVDNGWWSGREKIPTFVLDEMMATKTRALHQRRKGRDLLDLWLVLTTQSVTAQTIVDGLRHYMKDEVVDYHAFTKTLWDKLRDDDFRHDLDALVTVVPEGYDIDAAADLVVEQLAALLDHAPPLSEIANGAWREARHLQ